MAMVLSGMIWLLESTTIMSDRPLFCHLFLKLVPMGGGKLAPLLTTQLFHVSSHSSCSHIHRGMAHLSTHTQHIGSWVSSSDVVSRISARQDRSRHALNGSCSLRL